jgi:hypothetical protein
MTTLAGSTTTTGANDFFGTGDLGMTKWTAAASGTCDQMSVAVRSGTYTSVTLAIYSDSAGVPNALLGQSNPITSTTVGLHSASMVSNVAITSGVVYWLAILPLGGVYNFTGASGASGYRGKSGQSAFPNPWDTVSNFSDPGAAVPISADATGGGAGKALGFQRVFPRALLIR